MDLDLKTICLEALNDLKAQNILVLDIRDISGFADWLVIGTASSSRNAKAIANKLIESINTSLALHLVEIARELGRDALVGRLLDHAGKVASNSEDQGWCQFELMKHQGVDKDQMIGLGVASEKEGLPGLAAGIFHHVSLLTLGSDDAGIFANRSMRLREEAGDLEGMIYGHALLAHIAKTEEDFEKNLFKKIKDLKNVHLNFYEKNLYESLIFNLKQKKLIISSDFDNQTSEIYVVCLGTKFVKNKIDNKDLLKLAQQIGKKIKEKDLIILRGTVQLGATRNIFLKGLKKSTKWLKNERLEILNKKKEIIRGFKKLHNWKLKSCGAYFAYIEHPFSECASVICKKLLSNQAILSLPETMFTPKSTESIKKHIRIAFANINKSEINELFKRLKDFEY